MLPMNEGRSKAAVTSMPSSRKYNDHELVAGLKASDPTICAAFFDQYNGQVNRMVWKLLGQDVEHNDVVSNVFVDILTSIGSLKEPQALPRWVSSVSVNAVRRELRNRKYRRLFTPLGKDSDIPAAAEEKTGHNIYRRIFAVMKTMSPDNQIVFALRFIEGHTFDEIAEIKGCSLATAKRYGKRCRQEFMKKAQNDSVLRSFVEGCEDE